MPQLSQTPQNERERQHQFRLWGSLHAFVKNHHGWITTQPNLFPCRMECKVDSDLPGLLKAKGWIVSNAGTTPCFLPTDDQRLEPATVDVWELSIP